MTVYDKYKTMSMDELYEESLPFVTLTRVSMINMTAGLLSSVFLSKQITTVELPYTGNQNNLSCIPKGLYLVTEHHSASKGKVYHINNVLGRTACYFHAANYVRQLKGCIAPGFGLQDIDGDGEVDATSSKDALDYMFKQLGEAFILKIN